MLDFLNNLSSNLNEFIMNAGVLAPLVSSIFIILEGIFAFLPLVAFITINILALGTFCGSLISWMCTVIGNFTIFFLCRIGLSRLLKKLFKNPKHLTKFTNMVTKMPFSRLVFIISIPLTPSFFVNVAAGISNMPKKKYLYALILGKVCIVGFWGILGTSIIDCFNNPLVLIKVVLMILFCYIFSRIFNKKFDIDKVFEDHK